MVDEAYSSSSEAGSHHDEAKDVTGWSSWGWRHRLWFLGEAFDSAATNQAAIGARFRSTVQFSVFVSEKKTRGGQQLNLNSERSLSITDRGSSHPHQVD